MLELKNTSLGDIEPLNDTDYGDYNYINGSEDMVNDESHSRSRSRSQTQVIEIPESFFSEIVDAQQLFNTNTEMENPANLSSLASQDVSQQPETQDSSQCEKKLDCV